MAFVATMLFITANAFAFKCESIEVFQIIPNPMTEQCTVYLQFAEPTYISLCVITLGGEVVSDVYNGYANKEMTLEWDRYSNSGQYVPDGTYMMVLNGDQRYTSTKKTLILK